jgi:hypothetical protein
MSQAIDRSAIAARIRHLLGAENPIDIDALADRLRVGAFALRRSLDEMAPDPTLDVLASIVQEFGVDPSWLVHGEYNSATHHAVLDDNYNVRPVLRHTLATPPNRIRPPAGYELRADVPIHVEPRAPPGSPFAFRDGPTRSRNDDDATRRSTDTG